MVEIKRQFEKAYEDYANAIFRHCYFRVHDRERAKELVQEVFTKTWQYLAQGHTIDNIRAFLYRVAHNLILNEWRKQSEASLDSMSEDEGFDPQNDDDLKIVSDADAGILMKYLDKLPKRNRDVIVMRYIDEMGVNEIAAVTGESVNVISVRIHRTLKQLKTILQEYENRA
ncbi:MAG: sigma-70 family RNA polymerase sigma factor [Patescibacteria group bacterium]